MSCGGKIKQTCGITVYAPCVRYEKDIPEYSPLSEEDCVNIEETTEDLYELLGEVKEDLNLSELGQLCLTYVPSGQTPKVKDILLKYEQEICDLKGKIEELENTDICNKSIIGCGLDLSGLEDQCDQPITTLGQLLQYFITNITP